MTRAIRLTPFQECVRRALSDRSHKDLAEEAGVDRSVVTRWLAGTAFPGNVRLERVAAALHVTIGGLVRMIEESRR